ncbi:BTAD domain-containing putative transcriptional regulator [Actinokineospora diospyrosa]|uniref:BTAD domain-containing putative transcriptional regulator n=1 Tax=Actinokineospora diospyrosa TaxID=103728 RepID=UPI0020A44F25|nr:BTAD domain-containing putative transcriptional regulator [Actinokineospora diospyrosa]
MEAGITPKARAMLASLLVRAGGAVSAGTLVDWVWDEEKEHPRNVLGTLDNYATKIRNLLGQHGMTFKLTNSRGTFRLEVDRKSIDFHIFGERLRTARVHIEQGDPAGAMEQVTSALSLLRGPPLDDLTSEPAAGWRYGFEQNQVLPAHFIRLTGLLKLDRAADALQVLEQLQAEHPSSYRLHRLRMTTLHALGRRQDEIEYFTRVRRQMAQEGDLHSAKHLTKHHEELHARRATSRPAMALAEPPQMLPHDITDFVGRSALLRALDALTSDAKGRPLRGVVLVEGMPGVGKTALAVRWAHRAKRRYPDGILYIDLHGFSQYREVDHATIVDSFLTHLGHGKSLSRSLGQKEALLRETLSAKVTLTVLDNARDSAQIREIVPLLAGSLVLVTSRQRLSGLSTGYSVRRIVVPQLLSDESLALLRVQAGAQSTVDEQSLEELAGLCGGLPLALTVLGYNIADCQIKDADGVDRLSALRRRLLKLGATGDQDVTPHSVFAQSYRMLTTPARRAFRLLSLHFGYDFSVEVAAAGLGRPKEEVGDTLATLVGAHLISRSNGVERYRYHDLLRESARRFAADDDIPAECGAAERRMLAFYLAQAIEADRALIPEHPLPPPMPVEPQIQPPSVMLPRQARIFFAEERANLVSSVLQASRQGYHGYAWRLPNAAFTFYEEHGSYAEDCRLVREAAVISARAEGNEIAEGSSLLYLARSYMELGQLERAKEYLDISLGCATRAGMARAQLSTLYHLGKLEVLRDNHEAAAALFERSLELARQEHDQEGLSWTKYYLGVALRAGGRTDDAMIHFHEAKVAAEELRDESLQARCLCGMAAVLADRGEHHMAASYCAKALRLVEPAQDIPATTLVHLRLAEVHLAREALGAARDCAGKGLSLAEEGNRVPAMAEAHRLLGAIAAGSGDRAATSTHRLRAIELYSQLGNRAMELDLRRRLEEGPPEGTT